MTGSIKELFREKGISPSFTRTKIYHFLDEAKSHPTVDEIYKALIDELPTLSKTTVYNVLKLFCEHDLVKPVNMSSSEMRYELNHAPHSHFRCIDCDKIYDIPYIKPTYDHKDLHGFVITEEEVNISGVCPTCQQKNLA